jgi:AcrR family transcriptional regulator
MVAATRRIGGESSATRAAMLEATEALMREEGYAAVSTRKVAARAGLKPSLVHYYFPTTDDLLIALFRRGADQSDAILEEALSASDPLRALWDFFADTSRTALALEFMALANHRKAIRAFMVEHSEQMRARQVAMLARLPVQAGSAFAECPPAGLSLLLAGIGRALVMEGGMGVVSGHAEARDFVGQWLERLASERELQE